ncbi:MAG: hypothetical protein KF745_08655 [Phycisphaeraceae bacterium]|nr:hypothetical protein [Phycisphaeraceae bacterium]
MSHGTRRGWTIGGMPLRAMWSPRPIGRIFACSMARVRHSPELADRVGRQDIILKRRARRDAVLALVAGASILFLVIAARLFVHVPGDPATTAILAALSIGLAALGFVQEARWRRALDFALSRRRRVCPYCVYDLSAGMTMDQLPTEPPPRQCPECGRAITPELLEDAWSIWTR